MYSQLLKSRKTSWHRCLLYLLGIAFHLLTYAEESSQRKVLVLYSDNRLLPAVAKFDEEFQRLLREKSGAFVAVYNEFLDFERFPGPSYESQLTQFLDHKYADKRVDAVVVVRAPALDFALKHGDAVFPKTPIIHVAVTKEELEARKIPPDVCGAPIIYEPDETLRLALKLHPQTKRIIMITGSSKLDKYWDKLMRDAVGKVDSKLPVEFWNGIPLAELEGRVKGLEPDSIIYTLGMLEDNRGQTYVPREVVKRISEAGNVPVYITYNSLLGSGAVGGHVPSIEDLAQVAENSLEQIFRGTTPTEVVNPASIPNSYILDWRQLRRFGVKDASIPKNCILLFKSPTFLEMYFWYIVGGIALLIIETALLLAIFIHYRMRKRIESKLRDNERAMGMIADAINLGIWTWDFRNDVLWATERARALMGIAGNPAQITYSQFLKAVHPDDRESVNLALDHARTKSQQLFIEFRTNAGEGNIRWLSARGYIEFNNTSPSLMRGIIFEVTAQKRAEEDLAHMRRDMEHMTRVSIMGELASALAHELNQPLAAILSNAQAGRRLLLKTAPNLPDVTEILDDIIADDKRAGEVIHRMRAMLRPGSQIYEVLNINNVIHETMVLLNSELVGRRTKVSLNLGANLPPIKCGRVEIQQVLINLVMNGLDAMDETPTEKREITISTKLTGEIIEVAVRDTGTGISNELAESVFRPFYSSKPKGLGMGLAICRRIIEYHNGRLWAFNNRDRGACLMFSLPLFRDEEATEPSASGSALASGPSQVP